MLREKGHLQWCSYRGGRRGNPPPLAPSWHWKSIHFLVWWLTQKAFFGWKILDFEILPPLEGFAPPPGNFPSYATGHNKLRVTQYHRLNPKIKILTQSYQHTQLYCRLSRHTKWPPSKNSQQCLLHTKTTQKSLIV